MGDSTEFSFDREKNGVRSDADIYVKRLKGKVVRLREDFSYHVVVEIEQRRVKYAPNAYRPVFRLYLEPLESKPKTNIYIS